MFPDPEKVPVLGVVPLMAAVRMEVQRLLTDTLHLWLHMQADEVSWLLTQDT